MMRTGAPWRASSQAIASPVVPAPTIKIGEVLAIRADCPKVIEPYASKKLQPWGKRRGLSIVPLTRQVFLLRTANSPGDKRQPRWIRIGQYARSLERPGEGQGRPRRSGIVTKTAAGSSCHDVRTELSWPKRRAHNRHRRLAWSYAHCPL
jgi:hypothetical protein